MPYLYVNNIVFDSSHTRTTTISETPTVLMPKIIGMEVLAENSITSKTYSPLKDQINRPHRKPDREVTYYKDRKHPPPERKEKNAA